MDTQLLYDNVGDHPVRITYAIPTYKRSKYIIDTIESIVNQKKSLKEYEILVINNDPEADMTDLIRRYKNLPISIYKNDKNVGMVNNLNLSIRLSKGKYVSMIHDDDMLCPNYNEEIEKFFDKNFDVVVAKRYNLFSNNTRAMRSKLKRFLFGMFSKKNGIAKFTEGASFYAVMNVFLGPTCGTLFNKERFIEAGLFDTKYPYAFDLYTFQNMIERGFRFAATASIVGIYRMFDSASNRPDVSLDFFTCNYELLQNAKNTTKDVKLLRYLTRYESEILYLKYCRNDSETKKLIKEKFKTVNKYSKIKYFILSISRCIYYYSKHFDFERVYSGECDSLMNFSKK